MGLSALMLNKVAPNSSLAFLNVFLLLNCHIHLHVSRRTMPEEVFPQQKLDHVESKVRKLVDAYKLLNTRLKASYAENNNLKMILDKKNEELLHFKNQDKIAKIVSSISSDEKSSTELKIKINEYIKEIDKCIAYLSEEL